MVDKLSGARVSSFGFAVTYNEKIRQPLGFAIETTGTLAEGCVVTSNTDIPGRIGIAGTCPNGVAAAAGSLLKLRFTDSFNSIKRRSLTARTCIFANSGY
ncbi:MAG TPA: hypothetical protein VF648_20170 [Pyrinomonadaceae bacterium]